MKKYFLSLCVVAALTAPAQKVSGKLNLQKGQTLEVTTNTNTNTQSMMGEMPMTIVTVEQYTVSEAAPGQIQLIRVPKRMKMNANMMGQELNLDSDNPKDMEGQFGDKLKEVMQIKQEFTIDATGLITAVKTDAKKKESGSADMGMMMPGMGAASFLPTVGQPSLFKILPAYEIGKGETWADSVNTADNKSKTVYTVKDITDKEILLDYTDESNVKTKQSAMGMSVDITAVTKNTGTVTLDRATGLLKQKTVNGTTESNVNAGGQDIATTSKTTTLITVK